jgi:hypothetical protein
MARNAPKDQSAFTLGWSDACRMFEHLTSEGELPALPPMAIRLRSGEVAHAHGVLECARFYGMDVTYQQSSTFVMGSPLLVATGLIGSAVGNAYARNKAADMARAQWRPQGPVRTVLTDQRILCDVAGEWLTFWHEGIMEFHADPRQWMVITRYEVGEPLMLRGPVAPSYMVALTYIVYGRQGLASPWLEPIAQAVAARQRVLPPP